MKKLGIVLALTCMSSSYVLAQDGSINYKSFQVGGSFTSLDGGESGGAVVRYLPTYKFSDKWSYGLSLDASSMKADGSDDFFAIGYMGFARMKLSEKLDIQLNAGAQTWTCDDCETKFVAGPTVSYDLGLEKTPWIKNVWAAYLPVFHDETAHTFQIGAGLQF